MEKVTLTADQHPSTESAGAFPSAGSSASASAYYGAPPRASRTIWGSVGSNNNSEGFASKAFVTRFLSFSSSSSTALLGTIIHFDDLLSPQDQLAYIKRVGKFKVSQLAQLLEVSRPTIYSWEKGSLIQVDNMSKIRNLYRSMREVPPVQAKHLSRLANVRLRSNSSVLETLKLVANGESTVDQIIDELAPAINEWERRKTKSLSLADNGAKLHTKSSLDNIARPVG